MGAVLTEYVCNSYEDFITNCKAFFSANGYTMGPDEGNSFAISYQTSERFLVTKGAITFYFSCFESGTSGRISGKVISGDDLYTRAVTFGVNRNFIGIFPPDLVQAAITRGLYEPSLCVSNIGLSGFPLSLRIFKFDTDALLFCIECWPGVYRFLYAGFIYKNTINGIVSYPYFSGSLVLSNNLYYSDYPFCITNNFQLISWDDLNYGMFSFFGQGYGKIRTENANFTSFYQTSQSPCTNYVKMGDTWYGLADREEIKTETYDFVYGASFLTLMELLFGANSFFGYKNKKVLGIISQEFATSSLSNFPVLFDSIMFKAKHKNAPLSVFGYIPDIYVAQSTGISTIFDVELGNTTYKIVPIVRSSVNKSVLGSFAVKME